MRSDACAAYAVTLVSLMTIAGSVAQLWGRKLVSVVAIVLFLVGSIVTAAAPNFGAVIVGRAIQGAGAGAIQVIVCRHRPVAFLGQNH